MTDVLVIEGLSGERRLMGEIPVYGGKNAALLMFPAALLFSDPVTLTNIPETEDIRRMIELLRSCGVEIIHKEANTYTVKCLKDSLKTNLNKEIVGKIRASVFLIAPLLSRFGKVSLPHPGGDNIGPRPVDLFIEGFERMGASCISKDDTYIFDTKGKKLFGAEIFLRIQSVGVTQSLMLAGVLAKGKTIIKNAAMEPEIVSVAEYLNECGAKIKGAGTPIIEVEGGELLKSKGRKFTAIPDRLETGTFLILGVLAGKDIKVTNCIPEHIESLLSVLSIITNSTITKGKDFIRVENKAPLAVKPIDVRTHEYPGFASDLQPPFVVLLTQAEGKSLLFETIYEERFNYVGNLINMGAKIITYDPHRISVRGKTPLHAATNTSPDIRAGLAYVLAAIIAKGTSVIHNVYVIDRGYEKIEERLSKIGVPIKRTKA